MKIRSHRSPRIPTPDRPVTVSVVVLNWNGQAHLDVCLRSLRRQRFSGAEVILVDNGSTDGSPAYVRQHFPEVRVIENQANLGFCAGNNIGIRAAGGRLVALLNNDTEASPNWLTQLVEAAAAHPEAGMFASKMLNFHNRRIIDSAGDQFHVAGFAIKRGWRQNDDARFQRPCSIFGACAGAAMYRRAMLDDVGLLDSDFFANGEDVDLSFRAQLRGYACRFVPQAVVYHKGGATIGKSPTWFYLMRRNQLWVLIKNMPAALMRRYLAQILFYNLASVVYHPVKGRGKLIFAAYRDALAGFPAMRRKRARIQPARRASLRDINAILTRRGLLRRARLPIVRQLDRSGYTTGA